MQKQQDEIASKRKVQVGAHLPSMWFCLPEPEPDTHDNATHWQHPGSSVAHHAWEQACFPWGAAQLLAAQSQQQAHTHACTPDWHRRPEREDQDLQLQGQPHERPPDQGQL